MQGRVSSLNVSVAAGIMVYEVLRGANSRLSRRGVNPSQYYVINPATGGEDK